MCYAFEKSYPKYGQNWEYFEDVSAHHMFSCKNVSRIFTIFFPFFKFGLKFHENSDFVFRENIMCDEIQAQIGTIHKHIMSARGVVGVRKVSIFADFQYYLCWRRLVGGPKKDQKHADVIYEWPHACSEELPN